MGARKRAGGVAGVLAPPAMAWGQYDAGPPPGDTFERQLHEIVALRREPLSIERAFARAAVLSIRDAPQIRADAGSGHLAGRGPGTDPAADDGTDSDTFEPTWRADLWNWPGRSPDERRDHARRERERRRPASRAEACAFCHGPIGQARTGRPRATCCAACKQALHRRTSAVTKPVDLTVGLPTGSGGATNPFFAEELSHGSKA